MKSLIPAESLKHHLACLGKTGSGKTSVIKAAVIEPALSKDERVCLIDPTDAWWGLRLKANGKDRGFPVYVFGGPHKDYPLLGSHGEAIAEMVGTTNTPVILCTKEMKTLERMRFFTDFADAILRTNRGLLRIVIDEAHIFMPQAGTRGSGAMPDMLHAGNNLISLGRSSGIRVVLISQRAAKLHKDSLTQVETLIACRLIAPQDRAAVKEWIADQADVEKGKDIIASLPKQSDGQAWVWAPETDFLKQIQFPMPTTFDSSSGQGRVIRKKLSPVDLDLLKDRLAKIDTEAKQNDPKLLKAEVVKLKAELARKTAETVAAAAVAVSDEDLTLAEKKGFERAKKEARDTARDLMKNMALAIELDIERATDAISDALKALRNETSDRIAELIRERKAVTPVYTVTITAPPKMKTSEPSKRTPATTAVASDMAGERKPLSVLASAHPSGMTKAQWAVASGIKLKGSTFATYLSRLRSAGRVEQVGHLFYVTVKGLEDLGGNIAEVPPPGPALVDFWAGKISGAGPVLKFLKDIYPKWTTRDEIAEHLGIVATGSTLATYMSRIRSPGLIEEVDREIRLSQSVMGQ